MTDEKNQEQDDSTFAEMFAAQEKEEQSAVRLEVGRKVKAVVVAITNDTVFVSTGNKVDGLVEKAELEQDGVSACAVGDVLDLYVVHVSAQEVRLSKVVRGSGSLAVLEDAKKSSVPVEGKVTALVKGGFSVDIMRRRAFCPLSQFDVRPVESPENCTGKSFNFIITKLEQNGRNIVISRRALLEAEQAEAREAFLASAQIGEVREGTVERFTPFGAFVSLAPGVEGMVHVSELSWSRVVQPDEVLNLGDKIRVKILSIDQEDKKGLRVALSVRRITEDPWLTVGERVHAGDNITGKVLRLTTFGAFIEILPGIEGLAHISELSWEKRIAKAEECLTVGESVTVKVKEVDAEKRRVSLSLRDAAGDPWSRAAEDFPLQSEHAGRLEKRAAFGLFINLAPGVTGLMPNSILNAVRGKNRLARLSPGDELEVCIKEMDLPGRRITLAPVGEDAEILPEHMPDAQEGQPAQSGEASGQDARRSPERSFRNKDGKSRSNGRGAGRGRGEGGAEPADWRKHAQSAASAGGFSLLGSALAEAMSKKKAAKQP
ncbi:MAG: S1 RNA-binding domain-containing protein [Deltaproteobacteria bacterium]|nr:S1 RNA-binding domain-containing protein [Deltaproteobacteria bacterium]